MSRLIPLPVKTPKFLQRLYPAAIWSLPSESEKKIHLTFDDGPVPDATDFVLEQLQKHGAKATFFCVGSNVEKYSEIFQGIVSANHSIGNHTMNHEDGWKTKISDYELSVKLCQGVIKTTASQREKPLFRPPYGRLKPLQYKRLKTDYDVVMWDVLSYDFDKRVSGKTVFKNVVRHSKNGSIVVLHDSMKAFPNLKSALPQILTFFSDEGWTFATL